MIRAREFGLGMDFHNNRAEVKMSKQITKAILLSGLLALMSCTSYQPETTSKYVVLSDAAQSPLIELVDQRLEEEKIFLKTRSGRIFLGDQNFHPVKMELLKIKLGQLLQDVQVRHPVVVTSFKVEVLAVEKEWKSDVAKTETPGNSTEYWKPIIEPDQREIAFVAQPHDAPYEPSKLPREISQAAINPSPHRREDAPHRQDDPQKNQHDVPLPPRDDPGNDRRDKNLVHEKRGAHNSAHENESSGDPRGEDRRADQNANIEPGNQAGQNDKKTTPVESGGAIESGTPPQAPTDGNKDSWGNAIILLLVVIAIAVVALVAIDANKNKKFATVCEISVRYGEENISMTESNVYPAAKLDTGVGENTVNAIRSVANRIRDIESKITN